MAKLWAGRAEKETAQIADDFNSSLHFDCRMYRQDITGSMAHAAMLAHITKLKVLHPRKIPNVPRATQNAITMV